MERIWTGAKRCMPAVFGAAEDAAAADTGRWREGRCDADDEDVSVVDGSGRRVLRRETEPNEVRRRDLEPAVVGDECKIEGVSEE